MTKQTRNHCLKPEVGHFLHAAKRFQCCGTFGRQTGRAVESCGTLNGAKTVLRQYVPVPVTRMVNRRQGGSVSSSSDQDWPF